jgi:hypothetical protein
LLSPFLLALTALCPSSSAQPKPLNPIRSSQKDASGLTSVLEKGAPRFEVCSVSMIRVFYPPSREFRKIAGCVVIKSNWPASPFDVSESAAEITLTYDGRRIAIKRNLRARLTSSAESGAPVQYALQSQAMRSNLSTHNSGGPIE